ncbi:MAG: bacillithiol biosynthesis deacetylase BshB1, partial [Flavobacteriales bacterium]|nr:bacillithiol biosynthesis deacetylase BshB1 [Flavobacteriales bacterium]
MKLDILVFGAHPDDVELACSGTIIKHINQGLKIGVIDLTKGELGTRGSSEIRKKETIEANKVLG